MYIANTLYNSFSNVRQPCGPATGGSGKGGGGRRERGDAARPHRRAAEAAAAARHALPRTARHAQAMDGGGGGGDRRRKRDDAARSHRRAAKAAAAARHALPRATRHVAARLSGRGLRIGRGVLRAPRRSWWRCSTLSSRSRSARTPRPAARPRSARTSARRRICVAGGARSRAQPWLTVNSARSTSVKQIGANEVRAARTPVYG